MKHRFWNMFAIAILLAVAAFLSACNTIEGIGKDVEAVGEGTQDVARDANPGN